MGVPATSLYARLSRLLQLLGTPQTVPQLADATELSPATVRAHVAHCRRFGWITVDGDAVRRTPVGDVAADPARYDREVRAAVGRVLPGLDPDEVTRAIFQRGEVPRRANIRQALADDPRWDVPDAVLDTCVAMLMQTGIVRSAGGRFLFGRSRPR